MASLTAAQIDNYIDEVGRRNSSLHRVLSHKAGNITLSDAQLRTHIAHAAAGHKHPAELRRLLDDTTSLVSLNAAEYANNLTAAGDPPELYCLFAHYRAP